MVAIIQGNKLIFKAIDLLTAAAASAQLTPQNTLVPNNINESTLVLANNTHILNNPSNNNFTSNAAPVEAQILTRITQPKTDLNNNNTLVNGSVINLMIQPQPSTSVLSISNSQNSLMNMSTTSEASLLNDSVNSTGNNEPIGDKSKDLMANRHQENQNLMVLQQANDASNRGQIFVLNSLNLPDVNANQISQVII